MKTLKLQFGVAGDATKKLTVTVDNPKEDVTLAMCKEVAPAIMAVLLASGGNSLTGLEKAYFETVTTEALT